MDDYDKEQFESYGKNRVSFYNSKIVVIIELVQNMILTGKGGGR